MENQILKASSDRTPDLHLSSLALVLKANQIGARTVRTSAPHRHLRQGLQEQEGGHRLAAAGVAHHLIIQWKERLFCTPNT